MIHAFEVWLVKLVQQLRKTSKQASLLIDAFREARDAIAHPTVIAENRAQVQLLAANNGLGQNTAAIAALEAKYLQYGIESEQAMETYATTVLDALSALPTWEQPPPIAQDAGLAQHAAAVSGPAAMPRSPEPT